jgi:hypothetical protein
MNITPRTLITKARQCGKTDLMRQMVEAARKDGANVLENPKLRPRQPQVPWWLFKL